MNENDLIVYYTWSGNTGKIAGIISRLTGGSLSELKPVKVYPSNYGACAQQAKREINEGFMPELEDRPDNIKGYDRIFVGTPIWWYTMAPPVLTFLSESELSGRIVIPFCTHGGGGKGRLVDDIKKLCPKSTLLPELVLYGDGGRNSEAEISAWLNKLQW